jgi:hypothetical protein
VLYRVFYSLGLYVGEASYYQERMKLNRYLTERKLGLILFLIGLYLLVPAQSHIRDHESVWVIPSQFGGPVTMIENFELGLLMSYTKGLVITTIGLTLILRYSIWKRMKEKS